MNLREHLLQVYRESVTSIDLGTRVHDALPARPPRALSASVIALGKAAPAMAAGALERWSPFIEKILIVTPDGVPCGVSDPRVELVRAARVRRARLPGRFRVQTSHFTTPASNLETIKKAAQGFAGAARLLVTIMTSPDDTDVRMLASSERSIGFYAAIARWLERARRAGIVRDASIRQAIPNLMGLILFYPAVANDLRDLVGTDAFSPRARQVRKAELLRIARAMFAPRT